MISKTSNASRKNELHLSLLKKQQKCGSICHYSLLFIDRDVVSRTLSPFDLVHYGFVILVPELSLKSVRKILRSLVSTVHDFTNPESCCGNLPWLAPSVYLLRLR